MEAKNQARVESQKEMRASTQSFSPIKIKEIKCKPLIDPN
jgi:hypothetical protein